MKCNINDKGVECLNEINAVQQYIEKAWENFVLCEFNEGMKYFEKIVVGLSGIINCMENINNEFKLNIDFNSILDILQKIENCMVIKDYVYGADLLKYEIGEILIQWKVIIKK